MVRNINFGTGYNTIKLENPFIIELVYDLLRIYGWADIKQQVRKRFHPHKFRYTLKKNVLHNINGMCISSLCSLELILNNAGEDVNYKYIEEFVFEEDEFSDYFCHQLVVFYGSTQEEFINGCWKLYKDFEDLLEGSTTLLEDEGKTVRFNENTDIWDFYKKNRRN